MTANIDDILAKTEDVTHRRVKTVAILLDQELYDQHEQLEAELEVAAVHDAEHNGPDTAPALAAKIAELEARMDASRVEFKFRALSRKGWVDLLAQHPPTKKQLDEQRRLSGGDWRSRSTLDFNPETFPVAAVAACAVEPEMTVEQAARLEDSIHFTQFELLWGAVIDVNTGGLSTPKSVAAGLILQRNGRSATTAALEGSVAESS